MTLAQLREALPLPPSRVDLLAYFLVITRCAEVEGALHAPLPSSAMWAAVAPATIATGAPRDVTRAPVYTSSPRLVATAARAAASGPEDLAPETIRTRAASVADESPFVTLGVAPEASAEAARAAYFRLARLWNPERLAPARHDVKDEVAQIFAQMTHAYRLLTNPAERQKIVSARSPRSR